MNFILGIICMGISITVFSIVFSMIILSLFFGIPTTKKLIEEGILLPSAKTSKYVFTATLWITISFVAIFGIYKLLPNNLFIYVIIGLVVAFINSLRSLSKENYQNNISDLFVSQQEHINYENDFFNKK